MQLILDMMGRDIFSEKGLFEIRLESRKDAGKSYSGQRGWQRKVFEDKTSLAHVKL